MRRTAVLASAAITAALVTGCVRPVDVEPTGTTSASPGSTSTPAPTTSQTSALHQTDAPSSLRVAITFDQPGVGLREGDTYSGLDVDVARYVARYIGVTRISFVEAVTEQRETLLATGQADLVLAAYSITPDRSDDVTFAGPYLSTGQGLLVRARSRIRTPEQLPGFTVCSVQGSTSTEELVDNHPGLHLTVKPRLSDCVDLLKESKVNAVTADAAVLSGYARESSAPDVLRTSSTTFTTERWGVAMRRDDTDLCEDVNDALADMVETGAWKRAVRSNLGTSSTLPRRTLTPPKLQACPEPRPSTTSSDGSTPTSS